MTKNSNDLFQPYTLNNGIVIKNRLVVAPITHFGAADDGSFSEAEANFLKGRATDFGLFITASTLVSPEGKTFPGEPYAITDDDLPSLRQRATVIKEQGAKAILQLHHGGRRASDFQEVVEPVAPSALDGARELTEDEIVSIISAYGKATELAIRAGFDGVELHGANDYLLQQFFSAKSNHRQDKWGGRLDNRLRFPLAVVNAVLETRTQQERSDFIVGYRFSPEEAGKNGLTMTDTFALIDALKQKNIQYLHVSLWGFDKKARRGGDTTSSRIEQIHKRIDGTFPLIGVGNLLTAEQVNEAYQTGWAEFIAVAKAVLINPNFATLVKEKRYKEIETTIDIDRQLDYRYPERLWQMQLQGISWFPPLKGANLSEIRDV